jgi:hypothetical protein
MSNEDEINWQFDALCAMRYDMDSDQVDLALERAGLDRNCTLDQAKAAVREYAQQTYYNMPLPPWV